VDGKTTGELSPNVINAAVPGVSLEVVHKSGAHRSWLDGVYHK
jgi:hypothetical protein